MKVLTTRTWMQRQRKTMHQHSQICVPSHLWILLISISPNSCSGNAQIHMFNNLILSLSHINLHPHTFTLSLNNVPPYESDLMLHSLHTSVLAAIQSTAQKRCWRMPQIVATRQLFQRSAWTNRNLGRITYYRHEPHIRSCEILRRRRLEMGRVKCEGHEWHVPWCDIVQRRRLEVGCVKRKGHVWHVLGCDIF